MGIQIGKISSRKKVKYLSNKFPKNIIFEKGKYFLIKNKNKIELKTYTYAFFEFFNIKD